MNNSLTLKWKAEKISPEEWERRYWLTEEKKIRDIHRTASLPLTIKRAFPLYLSRERKSWVNQMRRKEAGIK